MYSIITDEQYNPDTIEDMVIQNGGQCESPELPLATCTHVITSKEKVARSTGTVNSMSRFRFPSTENRLLINM